LRRAHHILFGSKWWARREERLCATPLLNFLLTALG
jgi:hypothetical protein